MCPSVGREQFLESFKVGIEEVEQYIFNSVFFKVNFVRFLCEYAPAPGPAGLPGLLETLHGPAGDVLPGGGDQPPGGVHHPLTP